MFLERLLIIWNWRTETTNE